MFNILAVTDVFTDYRQRWWNCYRRAATTPWHATCCYKLLIHSSYDSFVQPTGWLITTSSPKWRTYIHTYMKFITRS